MFTFDIAERFRVALLALSVTMFALVWPAPSHGADLHLVFGNDFMASNRLADDLYTGVLELEAVKGAYRFSLGENVFTDRQNELRFDETYFTVERGLPAVGNGRPQIEVGVVHVGEGLLGQSAQNTLHKWIGSDEVDLPYVDSSRFHPTLRLRFHRPLPVLRQLSFTALGEVYSAIDFKSHVSGGLHIHWPAFSFAAFNFGVGARYTTTDFAPLGPHVNGLAPTWEAGVVLSEKISVAWKYNEFGTEAQHFTLGYDLSWGKRNSKAQRSLN